MAFNGNVSVHDMAETYMVPLQIMLTANVTGLSAMCACESTACVLLTLFQRISTDFVPANTTFVEQTTRLMAPQ